MARNGLSMASEYICDGCGKRAKATTGINGWCKPHNWFQRQDFDPPHKIQDACSRECVKLASEKEGTSPVILPI